jgi:hypothetical protein
LQVGHAADEPRMAEIATTTPPPDRTEAPAGTARHGTSARRARPPRSEARPRGAAQWMSFESIFKGKNAGAKRGFDRIIENVDAAATPPPAPAAVPPPRRGVVGALEASAAGAAAPPPLPTVAQQFGVRAAAIEAAALALLTKQAVAKRGRPLTEKELRDVDDAWRAGRAKSGALACDLDVLYLIATDACGGLVGLMKTLLTPHEAFFEEVAADDAVQGCGLSYEMFVLTVDAALARAPQRVMGRLQCAKDNEAALHIYGKVTFEDWKRPRKSVPPPLARTPPLARSPLLARTALCSLARRSLAHGSLARVPRAHAHRAHTDHGQTTALGGRFVVSHLRHTYTAHHECTSRWLSRSSDAHTHRSLYLTPLARSPCRGAYSPWTTVDDAQGKGCKMMHANLKSVRLAAAMHAAKGAAARAAKGIRLSVCLNLGGVCQPAALAPPRWPPPTPLPVSHASCTPHKRTTQNMPHAS